MAVKMPTSSSKPLDLFNKINQIGGHADEPFYNNKVIENNI